MISIRSLFDGVKFQIRAPIMSDDTKPRSVMNMSNAAREKSKKQGTHSSKNDKDDQINYSDFIEF